jgi:predicted metalloprotease with PDZ domain
MPAPIHYRVEAADLNGHRYAVELRIARPAAEQTVSLPVWIPGSYLVREFARHLNGLTAWQGDTARAPRQLDKCSWLIACDPRQPLVLRYEVYAFDASVRTAWLDAERGFFNGTSLLLRVHGQDGGPHRLTVPAPGRPALAAGHRHDAAARGCARLRRLRGARLRRAGRPPRRAGRVLERHFEAGGVPHRFVVAGAPASSTARACCATRSHLRDGHPLLAPRRAAARRYVFMLNAVEDGYGGLEHRASTALICKRADLPRIGAPDSAAVGEGYVTLLGLISHEYFHTWNVKRLKPAEFAPYDYTRENYTELLWFFEGFTSYYDDLLLRRAGLIDDAAYCKLLTKTINQVLQAPGRRVQSVAQASFDAWVRYYRPDENTPNSTISYYTKGALVALCLDLAARRRPGDAGRRDARTVAALPGRPLREATWPPCWPSWAGAATRPSWRPGCTAPTSCRWSGC